MNRFRNRKLYMVYLIMKQYILILLELHLCVRHKSQNLTTYTKLTPSGLFISYSKVRQGDIGI